MIFKENTFDEAEELKEICSQEKLSMEKVICFC